MVHCVKSVQIRTRKNSDLGNFHAVVPFEFKDVKTVYSFKRVITKWKANVRTYFCDLGFIQIRISFSIISENQATSFKFLVF